MAKKKKKTKQSKIWLLSGAIALLSLLMLALGLFLADGTHREIVMLGEEETVLEYGEVFRDPGVEIRVVGRLHGKPWLHETVYASATVDTTRLGEQTLDYSIADWGKALTMTRRVRVVDTQAPVVDLLPIPEGEEPSWMHGFVEPGFAAWDNVDGDLTEQVETTRLEQSVVYTVTDSSGNETVAERVFESPIEPPVLTLEGGEELTIYTAMSWEDPGFSISDESLRELVQVEGEVVPYRSGDYEISYTVTNEAGESVSALRRVTVVPIQQADQAYPDRRTIYLTFDDGPGPYTAHLLDVLARYNVKATFFVTGNQQDYADCIGRAYREGHSVGVHSRTHNYDTIYASEEAFFSDFKACQDLIEAQTGVRPTIFRFPGGSSNTVSRFNPGIMSRLTRSMTDMGYTYFDWNVSSGDAGETTSTDQVYLNVVNGCRFDYNVVLQHDIKGFSVDAVERIIIWGLNNGFQFLPLEPGSYNAHHGVNN